MKQRAVKIAANAPTRERLLDSALALFSSDWFDTVSVAEICRRAELSNGIFYKYYRTKKEIFLELLSRYLTLIAGRLATIKGATARERLKSFIDLTVGTMLAHRDLVTVFHEGQYRFPKYERQLRDIYMDAISRALGRTVTETEYLLVAAGVRFVTLRAIHARLPVSRAVLAETIWNGVFTKPLERSDAIFAAPPHTLEEEEKTSASRLIDAGVQLFGKRGYHAVSVYDVAKAAGFAVGSFYLYFPTKELFLSEIVRMIGRRTRRFIAGNLDPSLNRLERELQGLYLFLQHFSKHREYYAIVREAEFVVNSEVNEYYNRFESGYIEDLIETRAESRPDKRLVANFLMGIAHHFGIEALFSRTIADPRKTILELAALLHAGIR